MSVSGTQFDSSLLRVVQSKLSVATNDFANKNTVASTKLSYAIREAKEKLSVSMQTTIIVWLPTFLF